MTSFQEMMNLAVNHPVFGGKGLLDNSSPYLRIQKERPMRATIKLAKPAIQLDIHAIGAKWAAGRHVWKELRAAGKLEQWDTVRGELIALGYNRKARLLAS